MEDVDKDTSSSSSISSEDTESRPSRVKRKSSQKSVKKLAKQSVSSDNESDLEAKASSESGDQSASKKSKRNRHYEDIENEEGQQPRKKVKTDSGTLSDDCEPVQVLSDKSPNKSRRELTVCLDNQTHDQIDSINSGKRERMSVDGETSEDTNSSDDSDNSDKPLRKQATKSTGNTKRNTSVKMVANETSEVLEQHSVEVDGVNTNSDTEIVKNTDSDHERSCERELVDRKSSNTNSEKVKESHSKNRTPLIKKDTSKGKPKNNSTKADGSNSELENYTKSETEDNNTDDKETVKKLKKTVPAKTKPTLKSKKEKIESESENESEEAISENDTKKTKPSSERSAKKSISEENSGSDASDSDDNSDSGSNTSDKKKKLSKKQNKVPTEKASNSDSGHSSESESDTEKIDTKKEKKPEDDKKIASLKKYLSLSGIRITNFNKLWENCKSNRARAQKLLEVLHEKGIQGRPSKEKCRKLKLKLEQAKEVAELDLANIVSSDGRTSRRTKLATPYPIIKSPIETTDTKKVFSRIQALVDSDSD